MLRRGGRGDQNQRAVRGRRRRPPTLSQMLRTPPRVRVQRHLLVGQSTRPAHEAVGIHDREEGQLEGVVWHTTCKELSRSV